MRILLTKLSDTQHRMTIRRDDGTEEVVELESRSFLLHDFAHYAVEAEARIDDGVYGLLAAGETMASLNDRENPPAHAGLTMAESLAAPMQSLFRGRYRRELYLEHGRAAYPGVVSEDFIDRVLERLRRLEGQYKATAFRDSMQLEWPPQPIRFGT